MNRNKDIQKENSGYLSKVMEHMSRNRGHYLLKFAGILTGGVGGYLYYHFVGCASGTCPITSNPWITTGYGMLLGYLLFDSIKLKKNEQNKDIDQK